MSAHSRPILGLLLLTVVTILPSCGSASDDDPEDGVDDGFITNGPADGLGVEGSPLACGALRVANEADLQELDDAAGLSSRAAASIVERRPFATLAELDAAPYVGPVAYEHLVLHAEFSGRTCVAAPDALEGTLVRGRMLHNLIWQDEFPPNTSLGWTFYASEDTSFAVHGVGTSIQARARIYGPLVDGSSPPLLAESSAGRVDAEISFQPPTPGTYMIVANELAGRQGFMWVQPSKLAVACETDADCAGEAVCVDRILVDSPFESCAPPPLEPFSHDNCTEPGGTYVMERFTPEQACSALDFLNHASWIQLGRLGSSTRSIAYYSAGHPAWVTGEWRSLAQFTRQKFEYGTMTSRSIVNLRDVSQNYTDADHRVDKIADLWRDRTHLDGKDVVLERAYIQRSVSIDGYSCAEIRDEPNGRNYMTACHSCDGGSSCSFDTSWYDQDPDGVGPLCEAARCGLGVESRIGEYAELRGQLHFRDGRWVIDIDPVTVHDAP